MAAPLGLLFMLDLSYLCESFSCYVCVLFYVVMSIVKEINISRAMKNDDDFIIIICLYSQMTIYIYVLGPI